MIAVRSALRVRGLLTSADSTASAMTPAHDASRSLRARWPLTGVSTFSGSQRYARSQTWAEVTGSGKAD
jgi:hypothetical protein